MIKIVAKNYIKTDKIEEFIELAKKLVQETVKNDKGCIHYELFQEQSNQQILTIIEEWEDLDALNQHSMSPHFKEAVSSFKDLLEKQGETNVYKKII